VLAWSIFFSQDVVKTSIHLVNIDIYKIQSLTTACIVIGYWHGFYHILVEHLVKGACKPRLL